MMHDFWSERVPVWPCRPGTREAAVGMVVQFRWQSRMAEPRPAGHDQHQRRGGLDRGGPAETRGSTCRARLTSRTVPWPDPGPGCPVPVAVPTPAVDSRPGPLPQPSGHSRRKP